MRTTRWIALVVALAALTPSAAHASSPPAPPNCAGLSTTSQSATGLPVPVPDNGTTASTIVIAPAGQVIYDVDVTTTIAHTNSADLDVTLTSPQGTTVTLTTDNGGTFNDIFNGTTWDDDANPAGQVPYTSNNGLVSDRLYLASGAVPSLAPEEGLGAFIGQPVSGNWTLTVSDDTAGNTGTLSAWSLTINGSPTPPTAANQFVQAVQSTPEAISAGAPSTTTSTVAVSGAAPYLTAIALFTNITHTRSSDLDMTITSPSGTVVTLSTDNGGSFDDVFGGTSWTDLANPGGTLPYTTNNGLVTDSAYVSDGPFSNMAPEEALSAFVGENPNGTWTLTVSDDAAGEGGSIGAWIVQLTSTTCNDLQTTLAVDDDPAAVGDPLTYTVQATNRSTAALANATVQLPLPAGINLASFSAPAGWTCSAPPVGANGTVSCSRASVPAGTITTFTIVAAPTAAAIGVATSTATGHLAVADALTQNDVDDVDHTIVAPFAPAANPGPIPNCAAPAVTTAQTTDDVAIPSSGTPVVSSTLTVSGAQPYLTDLDLLTKIAHTFSGDLDVTLTSPAGTVVTLTTDNGGSSNDVFKGTTWDDDANPGGPVPYTANIGLATDRKYVNLETAGRLAPEEPLAAFVGENPNGTWTLTVADDAGGDGGTIDEWSLSLTGQPAAPTETSGSAANPTDVAVGTLAAQTSTVVVSGAGTYLTDVDALTKLLHNSPGQVDMVLRSPQGTEVTLSTDNGAGSDDVFNGTTWNDDANAPASDASYTTDVTATPLSPEEGLGAFIGENPNGTWTLLVSDDTPTSTSGTLDEWSLSFKTGACAPPQNPPGGNPPGGNPPGGTPPVAKAASLSKLKLSPSRFRVRGRKPLGTSVSYRLDKAAAVTFSVLRETAGRRSGKKCVAATKKNRKAKKCTRLVAVKGTFTHKGKAGANTLKFSGKLGGKVLPAGTYRLRAVATVGRLKSKTLEAAFKVAKP